MRKERGFTLIEIAIVLVIIGLLLGGVLKGQELITSARVRNLISQQDGIKAAFFGFQDRYRALPGDYAAAQNNISNSNGNGNGNGRIEDNAAGSGVIPHEEILAWNHLTMAGFMNGSYTMASSSTADPDADNNPVNPYSVYVKIIYDNEYGTQVGAAPAKHNLKTGGQVPVEIVAEVDRKIDDGKPYKGGVQFSTYNANDGASPEEGSDDACTAALDVETNWNLRSGNANCGVAVLL